MVIGHNMTAANGMRTLGLTNVSMADSTEKLSSGFRINRAADDVAGLSVSEKMRRQIRGLTQASSNAQDGISMVQTAEGAMNEIHDMLQRANKLAVKAANGTLSDEDRGMVDQEVQQLKTEVNRVSQATKFNELQLFPAGGRMPGTRVASQVREYRLTFDGQKNVIVTQSGGAALTGGAGAASESRRMADRIAGEMIPNAIRQILDVFPSLKSKMESDLTASGKSAYELPLKITTIDGPGKTLAHVAASFGIQGSNTLLSSMTLSVDDADFSAEDAEGTGSRAEMLESTIGHELMHAVMDAVMPGEMLDRSNFPLWFVEGTAQLTGGGYTTGWNDALKAAAAALTGENDVSRDADIENYLKSHTTAGRPYGHGYLTTAYLGYAANANSGGDTAVTGANIARGMDTIFAGIIAGNTLRQAVQTATGKSMDALMADIDGGTAAGVEFVRKLSYAAAGGGRAGAGSVIAGNLWVGGTSILGNSAAAGAWIRTNWVSGAGAGDFSGSVILQVGADSGNHMKLNLFQMDARALGIDDMHVKTQKGALDAIDMLDSAINRVSGVRSYYGATQNRLEHLIRNLDNVAENTTAAESRIRDTDMASEMVRYSGRRILAQAGQTMLAQANKTGQGVLALLS